MRFISTSIIILVFTLLFPIAGCNKTCPVDEIENSVVSFSNATHENVSMTDKNTSVDKISFIVNNDKDYAADCDITITLRNSTNESVKITNVGLLNAHQKKKIILTLEMFEGESDINIVPDCRKP